MSGLLVIAATERELCPVNGARTLCGGIYVDVLDDNATLPRVVRVEPAQELVQLIRRVLPDALVSPIARSVLVGGAPEQAVDAMEGFGVLRAAELAGLPAVEVRVISNDPAVADRRLWRIEDALTVLHRTVRRLAPALSGPGYA